VAHLLGRLCRPALFLRPPGFYPGDLGGAVGKLTNLRSPAGLAVSTLASHVSGQGSIPAEPLEIRQSTQVRRSVLYSQTRGRNFFKSKGIGCYMFRVDDDLVVDATLRGNAARFINHASPTATARLWTSWARSTSSSLRLPE